MFVFFCLIAIFILNQDGRDFSFSTTNLKEVDNSS